MVMLSLLDGLGLLRHVTGDFPKPTAADKLPHSLKDKARVKYLLTKLSYHFLDGDIELSLD